eukprot:symbB.v1.2.007361.t1/scaffold451.1/size378644/7
MASLGLQTPASPVPSSVDAEILALTPSLHLPPTPGRVLEDAQSADMSPVVIADESQVVEESQVIPGIGVWAILGNRCEVARGTGEVQGETDGQVPAASDISAEALDAAVRLVSITADVSKESLLDVYRQWCSSGSFDSSGLDLPIPVEEAEDDWMLDDLQDQDKKEVSDLFQVLEGHVEKQKPGADEPMANMEADTTADMPECEQHGFGNVPDLEELKKCCEPGPPPPELDPKQKKCFLPRTLPEALQLHSNGRDLFDAAWQGMRQLLGAKSIHMWNEHKLAQLAAEVDDPDFQRRSSRLDQWRELSRQAAQERNCEVPLPDQIELLMLLSHDLGAYQGTDRIALQPIGDSEDACCSVLHVTQDGKFTGGALVKELLVKARHVEGSSNLNLAAPAHHHPGTTAEILGTTTVGYIDSMASEQQTRSGRVMWDFITGMSFICVACHSILLQKTVDFWQARGMKHMDPANEKDCTAFRQMVMVHTMGKVICELKDLQEALPKSKLPLFVWVPSRFTEEDDALHDNYVFRPDENSLEMIS